MNLPVREPAHGIRYIFFSMSRWGESKVKRKRRKRRKLEWMKRGRAQEERCKWSGKINKFPPSFSLVSLCYGLFTKNERTAVWRRRRRGESFLCCWADFGLFNENFTWLLWVDVEGVVRWWIWRVRSESMRNETSGVQLNQLALAAELDYKAEIKILLILARAYGEVSSRSLNILNCLSRLRLNWS